MALPLRLDAVSVLPSGAEYSVDCGGVTASLSRLNDSTLALRCVSRRAAGGASAEAELWDYGRAAAGDGSPTRSENAVGGWWRGWMGWFFAGVAAALAAAVFLRRR